MQFHDVLCLMQQLDSHARYMGMLLWILTLMLSAIMELLCNNSVGTCRQWRLPFCDFLRPLLSSVYS